MPTDARIFTGRMNDDDHGTIVPVNDYRYAKNIHVMHSADGGVAAIKNVPGTTEIEYTFHPNDLGMTVVGSYEDEENNRVFYLVRTTAGYDKIICFYKATNLLKDVIKDNIFTSIDGQDASLGFSDDGFVTGIGFVYPWLFWTDNDTHPKRINVERGLKYYDSIYVSPDGTAPVAYSAPLNYKDITIIREPPRFPIETRKLVSTDEVDVPDQTTNQLDIYAFQFSYRFRYRDGSTSVLAPYSKLVNFNSDTLPEEFDTIEVKISKLQSIYSEVSEVEILVRTPGTTNWGIIKRYNKTVDSTEISAHNSVGGDALQFYFHNNYSSSLIPEAEGIKPFDSVPIKSKSLEIAQNRLFLGNNLEGYDPISLLLLSAEGVSNQVGVTSGDATYIFVFPDTADCNPDNYAAIVVLVETGDPAIDGYYFVEYTNSILDWAAGALATEIYLSPDDKIGDIGDFDPFNQGLFTYYANLWGCDPPGPGGGAFVEVNYPGTQPIVYGLGNATIITDGDLIFKSGSRYQLGLVFYDWAGRNAGVYTNSDCLVQIPDRTYTGTEFTTGISWLIDGVVNNNNIPYWATHYSIVRTENLTTDFFAQQEIFGSQYVTIDEDGVLSYSTSYPADDKAYAIAWDAQLFFRAGLGYTFAEGDMLKFHRENDAAPEYYSIIGTEGKYILTKPTDLGSLASALIGIGEIYTPKRVSEQPIFYEIGETYPITSAGTVNKTFSVYSGAINGDVVFKTRPVGSGSFLQTENMSPNDGLWQIWNTDIGRPNIVLLNSKQERRKTAIRWSNQYVAGAKINGLPSFDEVDELVMDESIGPIQKLVLAGKAQAEGSVMLAIGTNNTFSMYLGETQVVDNSDQTLLATSGRIIGTTRDLRGGYGTNHPESVIENDGRVYWYDEQRGAVIRYAANGLTPISDYKFRAFFNRLSGQTSGKDVVGGFDRLRSEYLITFPDLDTDLDVEWLNDYDGDILASGDLSVTPSPISIPVTVYAGSNYSFEIYWDAEGTFKLYVGGTLVNTTVFDEAFQTQTITLIPDETGTVSYIFVPNASPPRGRYTITGSLLSPHQAWRGEAFTIGFRDIDGIEGWSSFYSFVPEWFSKAGNLLLTFKDGAIYRHDNEAAYNTFYGTEYTSGIAWVVNQPAANVKWGASIGIQSNYTPSWVHLRTESPYIQSTDLEDEDFRFREGFYYSEIRRDRWSPNATGNYFEKSLRGDKIRSTLLEVYAEFSIFADELTVYLIKTQWLPSSGHF